MLFEAFPDLGMVVDSMGADGDRVWVRVTMCGNQHGPLMGRLRAARPLRPGPERAAVGGRQGRREMGVTDTLAMLQQLGLAPQATG